MAQETRARTITRGVRSPLGRCGHAVRVSRALVSPPTPPARRERASSRRGRAGATVTTAFRWGVALVGVTVSPRALASAPASPTTSPTESPADDPVSRIVPPVAEGDLVVEYPPELALEPVPPAGDVVVKFVIGKDGVVKNAEVERSLHPRLDAIARDAVLARRWTPATLDGQPVEILTRATVPFAPPPPRVDTQDPDEPTGPGANDAAIGDATPDDAAKGPVRLRGRVLEAGERTPIEGATITIVDAPADATVGKVRKRDFAAKVDPAWMVTMRAATDGGFAARGVLPGRGATTSGKVRVVVLAPGFERLEVVENVAAGEALTVDYYLVRASDNPYRTVVRTDRGEREEVARRSITPVEIGSLPGTQGDALKALQNFPGVARAPFGIGLLAIRGTGPNDSAVFLGGHEIPQLFHFGGLTSVFNADLLERIDFVPGNFDSRYGDALGGIVDVRPRKGRRDGFHGYVDSDVFDTGVLMEGPVGKGSIAASARRSYIDLILPAVLPDDAGIDLTLAPRYWDYQLLFDYPLGGGNFGVRAFGSDDRLELVSSDANDVSQDARDRFESVTYFHRADLLYEKRQGPWEFSIIPSYRYDYISLGLGTAVQLAIGAHNINNRVDISRRLSRKAELRVGTELRTAFFDVAVTAPPVTPGFGPPSTAQLLTTKVTGTLVTPAVYTTIVINATPTFTLLPGVRWSYYAGAYKSGSVEPRLRASWQVADRTTLKAGVGMYNQAPQPVEFSDVFGNPRLGLERAVQSSIGVTQTFRQGFSIDATGFFTYIWDEVAQSPRIVRREDGTVGPETFANTQRGRTYGLEILARKELTRRLFGWVAYTAIRSERQPRPGEPYAIADFDQTHILTLIAVVRLPRNWQFGGRFRLVSGNPNTPVVGAAYDSAQGSYVPINGKVNSERFPTFHQLDLRIDKSWVWRRSKLTLYLDVQNVYNRQNVEFWNYSYDFTQRMPIAGLPIIPSLGIKVQW